MRLTGGGYTANVQNVFLQNQNKTMETVQYVYAWCKNTLWSQTLKLKNCRLITRNTLCISFHNMLKSSCMKQTTHVIATVFVGCGLRCLRQFKAYYILNTVADIYIDICIQTQTYERDLLCIFPFRGWLEIFCPSLILNTRIFVPNAEIFTDSKLIQTPTSVYSNLLLSFYVQATLIFTLVLITTCKVLETQIHALMLYKISTTAFIFLIY